MEGSKDQANKGKTGRVKDRASQKRKDWIEIIRRSLETFTNFQAHRLRSLIASIFLNNFLISTEKGNP